MADTKRMQLPYTCLGVPLCLDLHLEAVWTGIRAKVIVKFVDQRFGGEYSLELLQDDRPDALVGEAGLLAASQTLQNADDALAVVNTRTVDDLTITVKKSASLLRIEFEVLSGVVAVFSVRVETFQEDDDTVNVWTSGCWQLCL